MSNECGGQKVGQKGGRMRQGEKTSPLPADDVSEEPLQVVNEKLLGGKM